MPKAKSVVTLTNSSTEKMSRMAMLAWLNDTLGTEYSKVEELCSGVAYCQMLEMLFPNCIGMRKVKGGAKLGHEYLYNLKLVQAALTRLKVPNVMPIDRLLKGHFQDNFEFLQWFRKFFMHHADGRDDLEVPVLHQQGGNSARQTWRSAASTPRDGASTARSGATSVRKGSTTARNGSNTARTGATTAGNAVSTRNSATSARSGATSARSGAISARNAVSTRSSASIARKASAGAVERAVSPRDRSRGQLVPKSKSSLSTYGRLNAGRHTLSARQGYNDAESEPDGQVVEAQSEEELRVESQSDTDYEDSPRNVDPKVQEHITKLITHMHQIMAEIYARVDERNLAYMRATYIDLVVTEARASDPSEATQAMCHQILLAMIPIFGNDRLKSLGQWNPTDSTVEFPVIHEKMPEEAPEQNHPMEPGKQPDMPEESLDDETDPFSELDRDDEYDDADDGEN